MKLTSQEEYGLRCLLQMARAPERVHTITEIAASEGLTHAHVAKLMRILRRAGLVSSIRGQAGGYRLAGAPDAIHVGTVLSALGGHLYSQGFCEHHAGTKRTCVHGPDCSIRPLWAQLEDVVQRALSQVLLKDLLGSEEAVGSWVKVHFNVKAAAR